MPQLQYFEERALGNMTGASLPLCNTHPSKAQLRPPAGHVNNV
jgi:hypothetical protein